MTFEFRPAVRSETSLLIGIAGSTGSGKTYSALTLAEGLAQGGKIAVIDTEAGRALHYADQFKFDHGELKAPFSPENYTRAIEAADKDGYKVIVIDSMSHEHEGEGGVLDWHDRIVDDLVAKEKAKGNSYFDEDKVRNRVSVGAWNKPKQAHKRMVSRLLQCRAHLIFCLRAQEKIEIRKVKDGKYTKTEIIQPGDKPLVDRWEPICDKRFMFEMTISMVMTDAAPGVPVPKKIQEQHKFAFPQGKTVSSESGKLLAEWANGKAAQSTQTTTEPAPVQAAIKQPDSEPPAPPTQHYTDEDKAEMLENARAAAKGGKKRFSYFWKQLTEVEQEILTRHGDELKGLYEDAENQL